MSPLFTVLITAYNYGCYIEDAIQSALGQTLPRDQFEVIVIDDGSTDDTAERVSSFGDSINYIYQDNAGQAAAFNTGIGFAKGEFIAFLDADDTWCPEKLVGIKRCLERDDKIDLVYHPLIMVSESGDQLGIHPKYAFDSVQSTPLQLIQEPGLEEPAATSGIICRTESLKKLMPIPVSYRICADSYIAVTAPLVVSAIAFLSQPFTFYRIHSDNGYSSYRADEDRYACLDPDIMISKARLDLSSLEIVSRRLGVEVHDYCVQYRSSLAVLEVLLIRRHSGMICALLSLFRYRNKLSGRNLFATAYTFLSLACKIILGDRIFSVVSRSYSGTSLQKWLHVLIKAKRR